MTAVFGPLLYPRCRSVSTRETATAEAADPYGVQWSAGIWGGWSSDTSGSRERANYGQVEEVYRRSRERTELARNTAFSSLITDGRGGRLRRYCGGRRIRAQASRHRGHCHRIHRPALATARGGVIEDRLPPRRTAPSAASGHSSGIGSCPMDWTLMWSPSLSVTSQWSLCSLSHFQVRPLLSFQAVPLGIVTGLPRPLFGGTYGWSPSAKIWQTWPRTPEDERGRHDERGVIGARRAALPGLGVPDLPHRPPTVS